MEQKHHSWSLAIHSSFTILDLKSHLCWSLAYRILMMIQLLVWVVRKLVILLWVQLSWSHFLRNNWEACNALFRQKKHCISLHVSDSYLFSNFLETLIYSGCLWFSITRNFIPAWHSCLLPWVMNLIFFSFSPYGVQRRLVGFLWRLLENRKAFLSCGLKFWWFPWNS